MENTPNRSSGIPRLSKLPVARPVSGIPKPTSAATIPRPTSTIRPSASRDSLSVSRAGERESSGELRNPRLRHSVSRDQLHSSTLSQGRNSRLRTSASRDQLLSRRSSRESFSKPPPPVSGILGPGAPSTPHRRRTSNAPLDPPSEQDDAPTETNPSDTDEVLFKRRLTLTRRPSEVFSGAAFVEATGSGFEGAITEDAAACQPVRGTPMKSRPSLSERTMETLAHIPSSPALRKKPSSFFDHGRPASQGGASRPGSSYTNDSPRRIPSRAGSRPGSSAGNDEPSFRASSNTFKAPLSTIEGTPRTRTSMGPPAAKTPVVRKTASRPSLTSASKLPSTNTATPADNRSPSPAKKTYGSLPAKSGSKTVAARPSKPRASMGGLFKKPSLPAIDLAAANGDTRKSSIGSAQLSTATWDGTICSNTPAKSATKAPADVDDSPGTAYRKSSAALRDQIAKAKAAKRAAAKQSSGAAPAAGSDAPIVPSDDGFDFGVGYDDPFGLRKGENPKKKVLQQRVSAARSSGRLNIAALGLKEMPVEVMKMYDLESIGTNDGSWAESVDLMRLVAADNELERLDDFIFPDTDPASYSDDDSGAVNIFGGLETMDLHGNLLVDVPLGFRRLGHVTSLNLSSNRLQNNCLDTISQMTSLRDLKLAKNLFFGPINSELSSLTSLEILDLHGNNVSALPRNLDNMSRLRILNLSENSFESLPFGDLAKLPLTELLVKKNKLSGTLIEDDVDALPELQTLDASANQLTRFVPLGAAISLPVLHALSLSMNRLQGLPDMTTWTSLLTLTVDENNISGIPNSFTTLEKLRHADFASNDIRVVPPEIARMDNLTMIRLSGNPLRDKKFVSLPTDQLKDILAARLEPPPPYQETGAATQGSEIPGFLADAKAEMLAQGTAPPKDEDAYDSRSDMDDFATPPTSAPHSPARSRAGTVSSLRSRSQTLSNQTWPVKQGGILDRSRTESSSLHPVVCSRVAAENRIKQVMLHNNLFPSVPNSLSFFAETLAVLSLAHNQLVGETYLSEDMDLLALRELNLSSNRITGLEPLVKHLHAPSMEKLDVSINRVNALPMDLKEVFPQLTVLLASNNQIADLEPEMIKGLKIVDASSNDISRLNPKIGLLGGPGGLERLEVMGNRFRVPRYNVLERGTDATLRWLRGRVPVAEMAAWKGGAEDYDDVD